MLVSWLALPREPGKSTPPPALIVSLSPLPSNEIEQAPPPDVVDPVEVTVAIPDVDIAVRVETASTSCTPLAALTTLLAGDPAVRAGVSRLPAGARSSAGAIIVWRDGWAEAADPDGPLAAAREASARALLAMPPDCLAEPVAGPRFVAVDIEGDTTMLVFGSGTWSWAQLVPRG